MKQQRKLFCKSLQKTLFFIGETLLKDGRKNVENGKSHNNHFILKNSFFLKIMVRHNYSELSKKQLLTA